jgi:hypothetical protein
MKILFLTDNFPPEVNAPATRTFEHCKYWVEKGVEVHVVTCAPNFPQGKIYEGYKNKLVYTENFDGIKVTRLWSYIAANKGFARRILDFFSFSLSSMIYLLFNRSNYDVIIATSPQFFTGLTAMVISKIKNIPWIFEVRDLWPEGIIVLKRGSLLYRLLEKLEYKYYKTSKGIVTVTKSFKTDIQKRFKFKDKKFAIIYNGANMDLYNFKSKSPQLINDLNLENRFVIGYAGTLGVSHSLDFVLDAAKEIELSESKIVFLFVGSGAMEDYMKNYVKEHNSSNIIMLPPVKKEEISRYISVFDVGLVPLKKNDAYLKVIPSKIFELAAMEKPILLGVEGETKSILKNYEAGIAYKPEDKINFIESVMYLFRNRLDIKEYSRGLKKLSHDFDRKIQAKNMLNFIEEITNENNHK